MAINDLKCVPPELRRDAFRLRGALALTSFGNGLTGVVLTIQIAKTYEGFGVSAAMLALSIGMLFSFASGGLHADSANRVRSIVISDMIRGLANSAIVLGLLTSWNISLVFVVLGCLVNGVCAGYFRPALASLWPVIVPAGDLKRVLSTNSLINRVCLAAGGSLGGILISLDKGTLGILIDAGTFFLCALVVQFNTEPRREDTPAEPQVQTPAESRMRKAVARFNVVGQWRTLFQAGSGSSWFNLWVQSNIGFSFVNGAVGVCLPLVLVQHYTNSEIGLFSSINVIALLIGAVIARMVMNMPMPGLLAAWANCGNCLSSVMVAFGVNAHAATGMRFSAYAASSLSGPSFSNYVAQQFPSDQLGKVYAMQAGATSVLSPLGMLLAGMLQIWVPASVILAVSAALGFVLAAIPLAKRQTWRFTITRAEA